jgi:protein phosphatase
MVEDDALQAILQTQGTPERWVDRMVAEANRRGGLDNITAIIVQVDSVELLPSEALTTGETRAAGH